MIKGLGGIMAGVSLSPGEPRPGGRREIAPAREIGAA